MHLLDNTLSFPHPEQTHETGILALGGDLSPERLILAYQNGIFPWYSDDEPLLWWSPDPRMVLFPDELKVSKSMRKLFRDQKFKVTFNQDFESVIRTCAEIPRQGQDGTWITEEMIQSYLKLHQMGFAQSVEVYENEKLVAGLYGINLKEKAVFCGESMFTKISNASKYGFISLVKKLKEEGVQLIDCQIYTSHLASLGAKEIPREAFLSYLGL